ncbi:MAG: sigma-70 family RNA polymerase sigma factor [Candidatus Micrarchaeota archaeon]
MTKHNLKEFFANVHYANLQALMQHAEQLSAQIKATQKPRGRVKQSLSAFNLKVKALAPQFLDGQYNTMGIARAIIAESKKKTTPFKKMHRQVASALQKLKAKGEIQATTSQDRRTRVPQLREVTSADMERHLNLIDAVMRGRHKYLRPDWWQYLSEEDAYTTALDGLLYGLKTFDPTKGEKRDVSVKLNDHCRAWIAQRIDYAARKEQRQVNRLESMDDIEETRKEHRLLKPGEQKERITRAQLQLLMRHPKMKATQLTILVLHGVYGHSQKEIARHFGVKPQAIQNHYYRARDALVEMNREK